MNSLYAPPIAFLIYVLLVALLMLTGRIMAGSSTETTDRHLYSSGEMAPLEPDETVPGYRPFFVTALFFAVLHLGVVVLATGHLSGVVIVYLLGLIVALITLVLE